MPILDRIVWVFIESVLPDPMYRVDGRPLLHRRGTYMRCSSTMLKKTALDGGGAGAYHWLAWIRYFKLILSLSLCVSTLLRLNPAKKEEVPI